MTPIEFELAIVAKREDGQLSLALMSHLEAPHAGERTCVAIIECSQEAMDGLCKSAGSPLKTDAS